MPEQRFSIGESCALLDVDRVTLVRWMELENITPQTDPRDKRYKYLRREDIATLARAHGRPVRDESTIGPRLTGLQREAFGRIQALEEQVAELTRIVATLAPRHTVPSSSNGQEATTHNDRSESQYSASQVAYIPRRVGSPQPGRLQPGEWSRLPDIPSGWKSPRDVAATLGVAERTFKHQLQPRRVGDPDRNGPLAYHIGKWRYPHPGSYASELLDLEQQEEARRLFSGRASSGSGSGDVED